MAGVYLADITSRCWSVSLVTRGRVVTTNVTNSVTLISIYLLDLLDHISDRFDNLFHCSGPAHKLTPTDEMS